MPKVLQKGLDMNLENGSRLIFKGEDQQINSMDVRKRAILDNWIRKAIGDLKGCGKTLGEAANMASDAVGFQVSTTNLEWAYVFWAATKTPKSVPDTLAKFLSRNGGVPRSSNMKPGRYEYTKTLRKVCRRMSVLCDRLGEFASASGNDAMVREASACRDDLRAWSCGQLAPSDVGRNATDQ